METSLKQICKPNRRSSCKQLIKYKIMLSKKIIFSPNIKQASKLPTLTSVPQADLCINIQNKLIPIHRNKLKQSELISKDVSPSQKILIIIQELDARMLSLVIAYFYGHQFEIETLVDLQKLLEVTNVFKINTFMVKIQECIVSNLQEYDTIALFRLSYRYELKSVQQLCMCYLEQEEFQQIKINKYSLYQCQFQLFQILIRRHHRLKKDGKIHGLSLDIIEDVISMYCRRHYYDKQILSKLYAKYVDPWKCPNKKIIQINKDSLRLHKLPMKNIGQSVSLYGTESDRREKQELSITTPSSGEFIFIKKPQSIHIRKYSIEADRQLQSLGLGSPKKKNNCKQIDTIDFISHIRTCQNQDYNQIIIPQSKKQYMESSKSKQDSQIKKQQKFIQQYLSLFDLNEIAKVLDSPIEDQLHTNARNRNVKSMIFQDVIQEDEAEECQQNKSKKHKTFKKVPRFSQGAQLLCHYN